MVDIAIFWVECRHGNFSYTHMPNRAEITIRVQSEHSEISIELLHLIVVVDDARQYSPFTSSPLHANFLIERESLKWNRVIARVVMIASHEDVQLLRQY